MGTWVFMTLVVPTSAAYGKKGNFLAAYPMLFKFLLFWWCVLMSIVMAIFVGDHVLWMWKGPKWVHWYADHVFKGGEREDYWKQFVDPSTWAWSHPVLMAADVKVVELLPAPAMEKQPTEAENNEDGKEDGKEPASEPTSAEMKAQATEELSPERKARMKTLKLGPVKEGHAFLLRHKSAVPLPMKHGHEVDPETAGKFYCMRECTVAEKPADGAWRFVMRTLDTGLGYPFVPGTEEVEVLLDPPSQDGSIRCEMNCKAAMQSRLSSWWNSVQKNSTAANAQMLAAIAGEVEGAKKQD